MNLHPNIANYIKSIAEGEISEDRKAILTELREYIQSVEKPKLNFICTHNSRRSHLSQIWAYTMAHYFGVAIETYSGGTEATSFHPNAIAALERAGLQIVNPGGDNPHYKVSISPDLDSLVAYSKTYDAPGNPVTGFAALMTCSEADAECPVVLGADKRIKLFYIDPKIADGTTKEKETYDERCRQIATEMYHVFRTIQ